MYSIQVPRELMGLCEYLPVFGDLKSGMPAEVLMPGVGDVRGDHRVMNC